MGMVGKYSLSFHGKVLIALLAMCGILVGAFITFQYFREKKFKAELLDIKLQTYNANILDGLDSGGRPDSILQHIKAPLEGIRLTIVGSDGTVVFDNNDRTPFPKENHNNRPEIIGARKNGTGFVVERWSASDAADYFYSAMLGKNGMIVRTAVPYNHSLKQLLQTDRTFLWVMAAVTVIVCLAGYLITRRISRSISNLNKFAEKAEKGERIFDSTDFPHDELGSIAAHIVRLYVQRDHQHREALRQEREKIRLKKQLTNDINHELKTPLASISVCTDLLMDHPELPEERKMEFLHRINKNVSRLDKLLKDVSMITRMDDGAEKITKKPEDVSEIINYVVSEERLRTDMSIKVDVPSHFIPVNRTLIESLFQNLIDNAIAYSGGTEITISSDGNGNFTFRDNGCGIEESQLPHIFERFYRMDCGRTRTNGGTGLGLAIVRNAVITHGGTIKASIDNGLRFDFNLNNSEI